MCSVQSRAAYLSIPCCKFTTNLQVLDKIRSQKNARLHNLQCEWEAKLAYPTAMHLHCTYPDIKTA